MKKNNQINLSNTNKFTRTRGFDFDRTRDFDYASTRVFGYTHTRIRGHLALLLLTMFLFALIFTGCNAPWQSNGGADGAGAMGEGAGLGAHAGAESSVVVAMSPSSEPEAGFDPAAGWGAGEHVHEPLIQSTLTVTTKDLGIDYDLATDLSVSDDGMLWTCKIRDDVYFTDGEKLTASDVAFTYNIVKEKSTVNDFTMLDYAEAKDDLTVLFHMNKPYSIMPYSMAIVGIVPEHAYSDDYGLSPIGSGRYIMKQWDKGQQVIFEANPNYYGEMPLMKKVTIVFMSEDAAFAGIKSGQIDVAYTASSYAQQEINGYELLSVRSVDNRGINLPSISATNYSEKQAYSQESQTKNSSNSNNKLNIGNNITADPAIRKAINIGIDRQKLIDNVLYGHGTPAYSVCDGLPWAYAGSKVAYDLDNALSILEKAGWKVGKDGIREKDGQRASLNIMYPAGDSDRQAIAAEVSNQLKTLGIEASYEGVGWDVAYDRAQSELMTWGWGAHTPMEVYNIYHTSTTGLAEYSPYSNARADALMDKALASNDLEQSYKLWQEAQSLIAEDVPWVWLLNLDHLYFVRDGLSVADQKIHPHGHGWSIVNNVDLWSWQ